MVFVDTRRWQRGAPRATAVLSIPGEGPVSHYLVHNLSAGGALLHGGPALALATPVHLDLRLPDIAPLRVTGEVTRIEAVTEGGSALAVAFRNLPPDVEDAIQQAVVDALERARRVGSPLVLVLGDPRDDGGELDQLAASLGRRIVWAPTPLEAVRWLQDPHAQVEAALVRAGFAGAPVGEVLGFLAEHSPAVRRILVAEPGDDAAALDVACTSGAAHAVLAVPWNRRRLEESLRSPCSGAI